MRILELITAWLREEGRAGQYLRKYEKQHYTEQDRAEVQSITVPPGAADFTDISFWQGDIDPDKMAANTDAVILRIGQGGWIDTRFEEYYTQLRAKGLKIGGYWFYDGRYSPTQQVNLIKQAMAGKYLDMELFIDWERNYGGAHEGISEVVSLMQAVENSFVILNIHDVGMYTGYYYFIDNTPNLSSTLSNYLKSKPLWLAWYASASYVKIPRPWTEWRHWQYGTPPEGAVYGVQTVEIDKNKSNGDLSRYGETEPPPGEIMNGIAKENLGKTSTVRTSPEVVSGNDAGVRISPYSEVEFTEIVDGSNYEGDKWLKLTDGNYVNYIYYGRQYYDIIQMPSTDPEPPEPPSGGDVPYIITLGDGVTYEKVTHSGTLKAIK